MLFGGVSHKDDFPQKHELCAQKRGPKNGKSARKIVSLWHPYPVKKIGTGKHGKESKNFR